jgi:hypothetical protein
MCLMIVSVVIVEEVNVGNTRENFIVTLQRKVYPHTHIHSMKLHINFFVFLCLLFIIHVILFLFYAITHSSTAKSFN